MSCWIFSLETTDASSKLCPNYMTGTFRQTDRHCYFLVIPTVAGVLTKKQHVQQHTHHPAQT